MAPFQPCNVMSDKFDQVYLSGVVWLTINLPNGILEKNKVCRLNYAGNESIRSICRWYDCIVGSLLCAFARLSNLCTYQVCFCFSLQLLNCSILFLEFV